MEETYLRNPTELLEEVVSELYCYFDSDASIEIVERDNEYGDKSKYICIRYDEYTGRTINGYTKTISELKILDAYKNGMSIFDIAHSIVKEYNNVECSYKRVVAPLSDEVSKLQDFNNVYDYLDIKIINKFKNGYVVKNKICKELFDFYITPILRVNYDADTEILSVAPVSNSICYISKDMLKVWKKTEKEIMKIAIDNSIKKKKFSQLMLDFLLEKMKDKGIKLGDGMTEEAIKNAKASLGSPNFIVMSNEKINLGASVILDSDFLDSISKTYCNSNAMGVIISSVHEAIAFEYDEYAQDNIDMIERMIREINDTEVAESEVASDLLYIYDPLKKELSVCGNDSYNPYNIKLCVKDMD